MNQAAKLSASTSLSVERVTTEMRTRMAPDRVLGHIRG